MRATRFEHRVGVEGAHATFALPDGREVDTTRVEATLNRLTVPDAELLGPAPPADRDYATQEVWATWLSWLHALPGPTLNPATPRGLSGPSLAPVEWSMLAGRAGLETAPVSVDGAAFSSPAPAHLLFVVGEAVIGPPSPTDVVQGCQALAVASACLLLGMTFTADWLFVGATPHPDLRRGGRALIDALAAALQRSA
jgi:hypothetical protein